MSPHDYAASVGVAIAERSKLSAERINARAVVMDAYAAIGLPYSDRQAISDLARYGDVEGALAAIFGGHERRMGRLTAPCTAPPGAVARRDIDALATCADRRCQAHLPSAITPYARAAFARNPLWETAYGGQDDALQEILATLPFVLDAWHQRGGRRQFAAFLLACARCDALDVLKRARRVRDKLGPIESLDAPKRAGEPLGVTVGDLVPDPCAASPETIVVLRETVSAKLAAVTAALVRRVDEYEARMVVA